MKKNEQKLRRDALQIAHRALAAADAGAAVADHLLVRQRGKALQIGDWSLDLSNYRRIFALSIGKAAVPMAAMLEKKLGTRLTQGLAVTKHGHAGTELALTDVVESGHPIPDEAGLAAGLRVEELLRELNAQDLLLVALSGGASALLPAPQLGLTLPQKQATTNLLLQCGADITELNQVRKHLSRLKGGRLAALAYPATVIGLLLSDVIGDTHAVIGSGLTAPDDSTYSDALEVLARYDLLRRVPPAVRIHLQTGRDGRQPETPKPGDPLFQNVHNFVIGSNRLALEAARAEAKRLGYRAVILASSLSGETREAAAVHAAILREIRSFGSPLRGPACLLSGGETTVTIRGQGKGGRNQEFALAAALGLEGVQDALVLSLGTDGTDGPTDAAGAWATGRTVARARDLGLSAQQHLLDNNAYPFFDALGDLVRTGPTGTNVMDVHLMLIL